MSEVKKVYCIECKYFYQLTHRGFMLDEWCTCKKNEVDTPVKKAIATCKQANKNNDCKYFVKAEPKSTQRELTGVVICLVAAAAIILTAFYLIC